MKQGSASMIFENEPRIAGVSSIAGQKEGEGPLGGCFDFIEKDPMFGKENWEAAESAMQKQAADMAIEKCGLKRDQIRYLFAGDLLGQLIATSFGTVDLEIPLFGLYGACSTMGEALCLAAMTVDSQNADYTMALASSHFASAEKQFRFPLGYGNQRPLCASWTVIGCGCAIVGGREGMAKITGATVGQMVDFGIKDSMNMGAAMAPAAAHTIKQHLEDFQRDVSEYDKIVTGDLGKVGSRILQDLLKEQGISLEGRHFDCGKEIFDSETQDTHAGGSGCGCAASVLCGHLLPKLRDKEWKRILFVPTGALLSQISFNEGQSIPGIAHGVVIESLS